ncbi:unnamed protein product [Alopecurus aequalis]
MPSKCSLCVAPFLAVLVVGLVLLIVATTPSRSYIVAVNSVSGLNLPPSKDLVLDPQFNLTLRVASSNPFRHECMDADIYLQVSYRCIPIAASAAAQDRFCAGPQKSRDVHFVAKGTAIRLPGFLIDSLAADMRSGMGKFEVTLMQSGSYYASCGARRLGDGDARCGDSEMCTHQDTTTGASGFMPAPVIIPPEE